MPAARTITQIRAFAADNVKSVRKTTTMAGSSKVKVDKLGGKPFIPVAEAKDAVDLAVCDVFYPVKTSDRGAFRYNGKPVTAHQWAVYDYTRKIPPGTVTTYKEICQGLGQGSPRSVGNALRNNPFAPFVPCHRVVASNLYIGGFYGEWGQHTEEGTEPNRKMRMLAQEGVGITAEGYLVGGTRQLWSPDHVTVIYV